LAELDESTPSDEARQLVAKTAGIVKAAVKGLHPHTPPVTTETRSIIEQYRQKLLNPAQQEVMRQIVEAAGR
jgi:hypothetical protein